MFSFLKSTKTPVLVINVNEIHDEVAAERAADMNTIAEVRTYAEAHTECKSQCGSYIKAEIERREAWGWK